MPAATVTFTFLMSSFVHGFDVIEHVGKQLMLLSNNHYSPKYYRYLVHQTQEYTHLVCKHIVSIWGLTLKHQTTLEKGTIDV